MVGVVVIHPHAGGLRRGTRSGAARRRSPASRPATCSAGRPSSTATASAAVALSAMCRPTSEPIRTSDRRFRPAPCTVNSTASGSSRMPRDPDVGRRPGSVAAHPDAAAAGVVGDPAGAGVVGAVQQLAARGRSGRRTARRPGTPLPGRRGSPGGRPRRWSPPRSRATAAGTSRRSRRPRPGTARRCRPARSPRLPARFAPIAKDGSSPAASAAAVSSEVVVVLPWVPATATQRLPAIIAASAVARRSTRSPRSRPATSSALAGSIAVV